jgi:hypothetical protein
MLDGGGYAMKRTIKVLFTSLAGSLLSATSSASKASDSANGSARSPSSARTARRAAVVGAFTLSAIALFGCPVYSGSQGQTTCDSQGYCCDEAANCHEWTCDFTSQCPAGNTCNGGYCTSGSYDGGGYYYDAGTDATDCSVNGCEEGYQCTLSNGVATCLPIEDAATFDSGEPDGSTGDTGTVDGGKPDVVTIVDAGSDAQSFPPFTGCTTDTQCAADSGTGSRCLDGVCTVAANECFDSSQCPVFGSANEECVQGVCTPSCAGGTSCPTGYACSTSDGGPSVCSGNPTPCSAGDGGVACGSGTTCVDQHCVPYCSKPDSGGDGGLTCAAGLVCVDHGCIPDQKPVFVCNTDGQQDNCQAGSICLHHSCFISCDAPNQTACATQPQFNQCKPVTSSSGTYNVCGSATSLGTECNPTSGLNCTGAGAVCIDGFCH